MTDQLQNCNTIYFDNAATTLQKPPAVAEAVFHAINALGNAGRGLHTESLAASSLIFECRQKLAQFFGVPDPACIAFTSNATEALNTAIYGTLSPGDHVITTAAEHNSVLRPLYDLESKGLELTIVPCDRQGLFSCETLESSIKENTKAIICTHASNLTGNVFDIGRIGKIANKHGLLFIVDAAQTAGLIPIDVEEMNIDILCFTGHKGLMGPQGTGGIYVRPGTKIRPLKQGGSGIRTFDKKHPAEMPVALEAGTLNSHGIAGLYAALLYIEETGIRTIMKQEAELTWMLYKGLSAIPGLSVYGHFDADILRAPIVSFLINGYDSAEIADILYNDFGISTRSGGHCAPQMHRALGTVETGLVRVSLSHFNTEKEITRFLSVIRTLV